jgi:hypothetical protein
VKGCRWSWCRRRCFQAQYQGSCPPKEEVIFLAMAAQAPGSTWRDAVQVQQTCAIFYCIPLSCIYMNQTK